MCKACIDKKADNWIYYASDDFKKGQCCYEDCTKTYKTENGKKVVDKKGIPFQDNVSILKLE